VENGTYERHTSCLSKFVNSCASHDIFAALEQVRLCAHALQFVRRYDMARLVEGIDVKTHIRQRLYEIAREIYERHFNLFRILRARFPCIHHPVRDADW
jgi:hypothetical protein